MEQRREQHWIKHADFSILDMAAAEFAFLAAYFLRNGELPFGIEMYRSLCVLVPLFTCFVAFFRNSYSGILRRGYLKELKNVILQSTVLEALLLAYFFFTQLSDRYSRLVLLYFWGVEVVFTLIIRVVWKRLLLHRQQMTIGKDVLLAITTEDLLTETVERCMEQAYQSFQLKYAVLGGNHIGETHELIPVVADEATVCGYALSHVVDRVLLRLPDGDPRIEPLMEEFLDMGITVHTALPHGFSNLPHPRVEKIGGYPVMTASMAAATPGQLFLKRAMDICGSLVGLLITAVAFVFVAPVIYIQSPGPVFFSQTRIGRNGRRFKIYKFRSMYMDAEERKKELMAQNKMQGLMFKMDNDPRITPVGKFIRKTSIDELPQFWNVLKGDMSLVGTRPPTVDEYEQYEVHHKSRLAGKPGITGLWQVSGRSDITDFEEVVRLDKQYLSDWSIGLDIKILFKTFAVVFGKVGSV